MEIIDDYDEMLALLKAWDIADNLSGSPLVQEPQVYTEGFAQSVLLTMDPALLKALAEGQLFRTVRDLSRAGAPSILPDQTIRDSGQNDARPTIYGHFWGSARTGVPPTAAQYMFCIEKARLYYEYNKKIANDGESNASAQIAYLVDNSKGNTNYTIQSRQNGGRRFFTTETQLGKAHEWLDNLEAWIEQNIDEDVGIVEVMSFSLSD